MYATFVIHLDLMARQFSGKAVLEPELQADGRGHESRQLGAQFAGDARVAGSSMTFSSS